MRVNDVYEIEGVPKEFAHMSESEFQALLTRIPLGKRLTCMASWPERLWIAAFLRLLGEHKNFLASELPGKLARKPLDDRQLWILSGLIRWFGTNCGRPFVNEVVEKSSGQFFRTWDGKAFWYPNRIYNWQPDYTLAQLLDPEPPPFLTFRVRTQEYPRPTTADSEIVTHFVRWLSSEAGLRFAQMVLAEIKLEFKRIEAERARELLVSQVEREAVLFRQKRLAELGI